MIKYNLSKKYTYTFLSTILVVAVFYGGFLFGKNKGNNVYLPNISNINSTVNPESDFGVFWEVWSKLNEKSIYADSITDQERIWGAAAGLASALGDPYTVFFEPEEGKVFSESIKGSFGGIGAEIGIKDRVLTVVAPLKDTPAFRAGIKSGDKIIKIGDIDTTDMTVDKAITLIRGEKGTNVVLTVFRPGEKKTREFSITRDTILIPTIDTKLRDDGVFVISLYSFTENSAELFRQALLEFSKTNSDKLILDLRGNPGGYLESAISMASWFVPEGKVIVTEDYGDKKKADVFKSRGPRVFNENLKMVVLVDGGSASASEILAGALRQNGIAKLVGQKTFGKGSVQEVIKINDGTLLKVTIAKWLTPDGTSISEEGLKPDYVVEITDKDAEKDLDPQMQKAIELLNLKL
jgi:carboxyl-terminal processing protease